MQHNLGSLKTLQYILSKTLVDNLNDLAVEITTSEEGELCLESKNFLFLRVRKGRWVRVKKEQSGDAALEHLFNLPDL